MKQYLELCNKIMTEGKWVYNERTGKNCLTLINADLEYDVGNNVFPLLTTRKSYYKSAIAEFLGYIRGYDNAQDFRKLGTKTWDANANKTKAWLDNPNRKGEDDMGRSYRFRDNGYYINTPIELKNYTDNTLFNKHIMKSLEVPLNGIVGTIHTSKSSGDFKVIRNLGSSDDKRIQYLEIQFLETGFITTIQKSQLKTCNIKDPYYTSVFGVGRLGELKDCSKPHKHFFYKTWTSIIERCYNPLFKYYHKYGGAGVKVSNDWLTFANFVRDFESTYNWELKKVFPKDYTIDKDWCGAKLYSKDTVRWSTRKEQAINTSNVKTYRVANGTEVEFVKGLGHLSLVVGLSAKQLSAELGKSTGEIKVNEYIISIDTSKNITYIEVDQLKLIVAKLTLGIDDRRLIMSAHNPHLNEYACLPACMHTHTFSLVDGTLHLTSYQRSCDTPLGLNFNQVQVFFFFF